MAEIATFLLEHLGLPALIIVFGVIADYISTPELKQIAIEKISKRQNKRARFGKELLGSFLTEFLYRIFDKHIGWRFLTRSTIVSAVLLFMFFCIQLFFYDEAAEQLSRMADRWSTWIAVAILVVGVNIGIDFLSNAATVILLRLASTTGRLVDTLIVILADLSLTIVLFTLLFPVAIVAATIVVDRATVTAKLEAKPVESKVLTLVDELIPRVGSDKELKLFAIDLKRVNDTDANSALVYLWVRPNKSIQSVLQDFAELSGRFGPTKVITTKAPTDEKVELSLSIAKDFQLITLVRFLYYKAFVDGNVVRDKFLEAIRLEPTSAKYEALYTAATEHHVLSDDAKEFVFRIITKCQDGEIKLTRAKTLQSAELPCQVEALVVLSNLSDDERLFRRVALGSGGVPISPFFLTSFASSVIYYFALVMLLMGASILRVVRKVVEMPYVETTTKPFTILGLILFVPAFALWSILRWLF